MPETDSDEGAKVAVQMLMREVRIRLLELAKGDPKLLRKIHSDFDLN